MDRAHRIGQVKSVNVYRLITENTVEEKILERQAIKLKWDSLIIQKGKLQQKGKELTKEELEKLVNYGATEIFKSQHGTISDENIDDLLKRGQAITDRKAAELEQHMDKKLNSL